jgi:hypothetical protein
VTRTRQLFRSSHHKSGRTDGGFRQATDIEDATHAVNQINRRKKRERREAAEENRPKPSMPKMPWDNDA